MPISDSRVTGGPELLLTRTRAVALALQQGPGFISVLDDEAASALGDDAEVGAVMDVNDPAGTRTILIIAHGLTTPWMCHTRLKIERGWWFHGTVRGPRTTTFVVRRDDTT